MAKILIVDDEAYIRTLLMRTLVDLEEDADVQLLEAEDGQIALNIIQEQRPDLVLLDIMMPKMNGFDVCHTVKHELGLKDVTVVLLTAKGQWIDKQRGAKVGADRYVTKPFDPDELLDMVTEILGV